MRIAKAILEQALFALSDIKLTLYKATRESGTVVMELCGNTDKHISGTELRIQKAVLGI